jgi:hypothetical protein
MPVGSYAGLPLNLKLNNVPHSTLTRSFVYRGAAQALHAAVADSSFSRRMIVRCTVPELNFEMVSHTLVVQTEPVLLTLKCSLC